MEEQKEAGEDARMIGGMRGGGQGSAVPFILLHHHWRRLSILCQAGWFKKIVLGKTSKWRKTGVGGTFSICWER